MLFTINIGQRQEKVQVVRIKIGMALMLTMSIILMSRPMVILCNNILPVEINELMENGIANKHEVENFGTMDKRKSWQNLHGVWGKRSFMWKEFPQHDDVAASSEENEPEAWLHVTMPVNKDDRKNHDKISLIYLSNDKTQNDNQQTTVFRDNDTIDDQMEGEDELLMKKRIPQNVNVAWRKQRQHNAPTWKVFNVSLGKREPGWNNLKGMWGKRSMKQWQKLHSGWGKRDQPINYDDNNN